MNDYKPLTKMRGGEDLESVKTCEFVVNRPVRTNEKVEINDYLPLTDVNVKKRNYEMDNYQEFKDVKSEESMSQEETEVKVNNENTEVEMTEEKKKRTPYDGSTSHGVNVDKLDNIESVTKAIKRLRLRWDYLKNQHKVESEVVKATDNSVEQRVNAMNNAEAIKSKMEKLQTVKAEIQSKTSELKEKALRDLESFDPSAIDNMTF
ncbi:MAG: hypothetical protein ACP5D6_10700 [Kosmotogaceae bacterium]